MNETPEKKKGPEPKNKSKHLMPELVLPKEDSCDEETLVSKINKKRDSFNSDILDLNENKRENEMVISDNESQSNTKKVIIFENYF